MRNASQNQGITAHPKQPVPTTYKIYSREFMCSSAVKECLDIN